MGMIETAQHNLLSAVRNGIKSFLGIGLGSEGSWRGPFSGLGELGGSYMLDPLEEGWQRYLSPGKDNWRVAVVYACVMMSARAVSQCEAKHTVKQADGGYIKTTTSPASRILRIPNDYETWPQIITNTVSEMGFSGESMWIAVRDDRNAVQQVHRVPHGSWAVHLDQESHEIFYQVNTNGGLFSQPTMMVPARDVCHFRQHCPRNPLIGESPIASAAFAIGLQVSLNQSQLAFFSNLDRPSGTLQTDLELTKDQILELRARFNEQSKRWNAGGTPILSHGLKFQPVGVAQNDAQLIEQQKMSALDIARVFGVPYALLGDSTGTQGATESLISYWLSIGLGSLIETIERSLDRLFRLGEGERIELDYMPLLRVDQSSLIDMLGNGVQKGVMTPNEARNRIRLGKVDGGQSAYMQRQMTAMDLLKDLNQQELVNSAAPNTTEPDPQPDEEMEPEVEPEKAFNPYFAKSLIQERMTESSHE